MAALHQHRDLFPGALEMMILHTLRRGPLHGYAIAQHITQTSADLLRIEEGSLYPALHRMEEAGWIQASWVDKGKGRRSRVYELTAQGRKQLATEEVRWTTVVRGVQRVLKLA